ncbi:ribosome biogenesis factor YjgA [Marinomonas balearica]|uniref:Dual-action ribosomal maturation protein DarP n=1 Tax=Marinomonas balearica TaxID=491947 RepID=A0A4R6MGG5_9GAMM|nr:ribosome biogenesis factor YjgA [Marinomonas balearica]TDO99880.1 ribosome-associated protein [Marinomonas balearica]
MTEFEQYDEFDDENYKSKTQVKREMEALQELGKKLVALSKSQRIKVPMTETLRDALDEADRIKQREAQRRHLQYIGKVMRSEDHEEIQHRVDLFDTTSALHNKLFQQLEITRDHLINPTTSQEAFKKYLEDYPEVDIQTLRQLIRQSQKEAEQGNKTTSKKKLFKLLREQQEAKLKL